ncbi:MAG: hypothetical protein QG622_1396 [Actinomycetota bacterium]|nr:hypothetical protein [Actinomycetota bacterium]
MRWPWARRKQDPPDPYTRLAHVSLTALQARRLAQRSLLGLDQTSWSVDRDEGTITFRRPAGVVASAPVQIIGSLDSAQGTWRWGWDHPSVSPPLDRHALCVRAWGEDHQVPELTTALVDADDDLAWRFAAIACELNAAQGAWRCESGGTAVLVTFGTVTLAGPAPGAQAAGARRSDEVDWPSTLDDLPLVEEPTALHLVRRWMHEIHRIERRYAKESLAAPSEDQAHTAVDQAIEDMQPVYDRIWRRDDEYWRPCAVGMASLYDATAMSEWAVRLLDDDRWRVTYLDGEQVKAYDVRRFPDGPRIVDFLD